METEFIRGKFTEKQLELAIIQLFKDQDYDYVNGETMHRRFEDVLIEGDIRNYLSENYRDAALMETEIQTIINKLKHISDYPLYEGNRETFWLINEGFDLVREDSAKSALHIEYVNFEDPDKNIFKVVNQYSVQDRALRRPDMLVFVNGIPVAIFEFKTAIEEGKTIHDARKQITVRYARDIPKLLKYCCLAIVSDGANTKMGTIFTPYEYFYAWNKANDEDKVSNGISSLFTMVEGAFSKARLVEIIRDFVFYPDDSKHCEAIVCRYPQYFAATKMLDNICAHMLPDGDGKGGTYFGATGCGKTYAMMFLSRLLNMRRRDELNNPTIIIIVDREDLDDQSSELFVTAKRFLHDDDVRSIESRADLEETLKDKPSGGVYITTIQKFTESLGLLSDRNNIICISDEAHRTQTGIGSKLKKTDKGVFTTYGFAKYLRDSFPNATYCGFTGTPVDETLAVFGPVVDSYTMKESTDDGITVRIAYEPRLARIQLSETETKKIQEYYNKCAEEGSTPEQIEESQKAMSSMSILLRNPDRLKKLAADLVEHYETMQAEKPEVIQKAMIVCSERKHAYELLQEILKLRPEWGIPKRAEDESKLTKDELEALKELPKINLVATRGVDDEKELREICGTKEHRKMLDKQFKNNDSNFQIAVVVDMWITGFDVPSLAVMYIDKPLQKHTLVQTISRVNRVFEGKDRGLVVDYIGIQENMMQAMKRYGGKQESPIDEINVTLGIFRNNLSLIDDLMERFDSRRFIIGEPLERLKCLNDAAEYVQESKERQTRFMGLSKILKNAYQICMPSGELTDIETAKAQFYMAIRSIIYKQTIGDAPDAEIMNAHVEEMVAQAISCSGVESVVEAQESEDLFSDEFVERLNNIEMPITKFNALLKLVNKAIKEYGRINKVKAIEFDERLRAVVELYNTRDNLQFRSEEMAEFVDDLTNQVLDILQDLEEDKGSFEQMGISYEEKAFYDILVKVRDEHGFPYADEKCLHLAEEIKKLVDDKSQYADWSTRDDIKNQLNMDLTVLLYKNGYPPEWDEEVFEKVMEQAENFKLHGSYEYAVTAF